MKTLFFSQLGLAIACLAFAAPARAQVGNVGYAADNNESLQARITELESELSRYRNGEGGSCCNDGHDGCDGCCGGPCVDWFNPDCCDPTIVAFVTGDGWSDFNDATDELGTPNNFGNRFGVEATSLLGDSDVRGHVGASYGIYDYHGRNGAGLGADSSSEEQVFITLSAYRRASGCCDDRYSWAVAYDYLHDDDYGVELNGQAIDISQVRFLVGYMTNPCNEFGVWGAFGVEDEPYVNQFGLGEVEAQDQLNAYWRRYSSCGGETMVYVGIADPNFESAVLNLNRDNELSEWVIGVRGIAPLTCNVGLFGGFHYVIPSASGAGMSLVNQRAHEEENWNVTFGIMAVRGCNLPLLPVADNGWFAKRSRN
ncbi:MAG: hypothetical protein HYS13_16750 [Planctomycetia bacterium]|nr:hypothetical protein [Planctomycetia bacterium]